MFKCPKCGQNSKITDGRYCETVAHPEFIRVRKCRCGNIFYTAEIIIDYNAGQDKMSEYWRTRNGSKT